MNFACEQSVARNPFYIDPIREKFTIAPTFFDLRVFFSQKKENPFLTLMEIVAIGNRELHVVF